MTTQTYLRVAVPVPLRRLFDYLPPAGVAADSLVAGLRVRVPFGKKMLIGILVERHHEKPAFRLKPVAEVLERKPLLDDKLMQLLRWAADYYCHPVGEVFAAALPVNLRKGKTTQQRPSLAWSLADPAIAPADLAQRLKAAPKQKALYAFIAAQPAAVGEARIAAVFDNWRPAVKALAEKALIVSKAIENTWAASALPRQASSFDINAEQRAAVDRLLAGLGGFNPALLYGVTGSGKTEVYLRLVEQVLARNEQVLILVPEIGLTPQLLERLQARFSSGIAVLHSGLNDGERQQAWLAARSGTAKIILGTRSAVFVPLQSPGLIIIDEEHDSSFKQAEGFRYSARDLAVKRAAMLGIPVLLGSATPSLESFNNVAAGRFELLHLSQRVGDSRLPPVYRLDMRGKRLDCGLTTTAIKAIEEEIEAGGQVLLFINRRGYAPALICGGCGWLSQCHHCDVRMTVHRAARRLRCHVCSHEARLPQACPECGADHLIPLGQGTERLEAMLAARYPAVGVVRVDRDSTRKKGAMDDIVRSIRCGEKRILIGTQMLAKGHHFPQVGTVIILDADSGLYGLDFRAQEVMAQLITQVSGRAGRAARQGKVYIQTYHPEHAFFEALEKQPYAGFARQMLQERKRTGMPPHGYLALLRVEAVDPIRVEQFINQAAQQAQALKTNALELLGPASAPLERKAGRYHMQLLIRATQRGARHGFLKTWVDQLGEIKGAGRVRWSIDVDPYDLY